MSLEKFALKTVESRLGIKLYRHREDMMREIGKEYHRREIDDGFPKYIVPDSWGFRQEADCTKIIAVEIEDWSKIGIEKLRKYADLWFHLDATDHFDFELIVYDRYGVNATKPDICGAWYQFATENV